MLRSRVDEPLYSGYIPFHTVIVLPLQPSEIEVALLEEPVQMSECSVKPIANKFASEKSTLGGDRTAVPSDGILRSGRSPTVLAGPGWGEIYQL